MAALGVFLLLAPFHFLAPLFVLLMLSRPRAPLEIVVIIVALAGSWGLLTGETELSGALIKASAVAMAIGFGLASFRSRWSVLSRGGFALVITTIAISAWGLLRGVTWSRIELSFATTMADTYRHLPEMTTDPATQQQLREMTAPLLDLAPAIGRLMPGFLALLGLAGVALAALWQHRIARQPLGLAPVRFREFRFNDHLIWGAIFSLALMLAPLPANGRAVAANLVVLWGGLYAARGLAVMTALLAPTPLLFRMLVIFLAVVLNPLMLGLCIAMGLADTWLDLRGRLLPSAPQGVS